MKKYIFNIVFFILCGLVPLKELAQRHTNIVNDTAQKRRTILKINPLLSAIELGGTLQVPVGSDIDLIVGVGYNPYLFSGEGYTLRGGVFFLGSKSQSHNFKLADKDYAKYGYYVPNEKIKYISIQFLYRNWKFYNMKNYDGIVVENYIINPLFQGVVQEFPTELDNATVSVYLLDVLYGNEMLLFKSKHFIFQWYVGSGIRFKIIQWKKLGDYDPSSGAYYPLPNSQNYSENKYYPDLKLGINFGYRF